jgi:outer membrane protein W
MRLIIRFVVTAALLALPSAAHAQLQVSPFAGVTFGGDTTSKGGTVGVAATYWVRSWIGVEAEAAVTPMLFAQDGFLTSRSVTTVTGNIVASSKMIGNDRWRPFVSVGLGLLRPNLAEAGELNVVKGNTLGLSVGAGVTGFMNDHVGLRADVRYLRGLRDSDLDTNAFGVDFSTFAFWRTTAGLVVKF